jgi:hypothetical protein
MQTAAANGSGADFFMRAALRLAQGLQVLHLALEELTCGGADGPCLELVEGLPGVERAAGAIQDDGTGDDGLGHRSTRRKGGFGTRRLQYLGGLRSGKFGPDKVPVVWTQIAAGYSACGCAFNSHAVRGPRPAIGITVLPLPYLGIAWHTGALAQLANSERPWAR